MFLLMPESEGKILGFRATGRLTEKDYKEVLVPTMEALISKHSKIRLLVFLDEEFAGHELGALWEDTKFFPRHQADFEKVAIAGAPRWVEVMIKLLTPLMEGEARTFSGKQLQEAWDWIRN